MGSGGLGERNRDFHEDPFQEEMVLAWKRPCMPCSLLRPSLHPSLHPHGSRGIVQESLSALEGVGFFGGVVSFTTAIPTTNLVCVRVRRPLLAVPFLPE